MKDLLIIRGQNHYPQDIEASAENAHQVVLPGSTAAFTVPYQNTEALVLIAEVRSHDEALLTAVDIAIRSAIVEAHGLALHDLVLVDPRSVPKTSSGKIRRQDCRAMWLSKQFTPLRSSTAERLGSDSKTEPDTSFENWLIATVTDMAGGGAIHQDTPLPAIGLDSLMIVELQQAIQQRLGYAVDVGLLYDAHTLAELAQTLTAVEPPKKTVQEPKPAIVPATSPSGPPHLSAIDRSMLIMDRPSRPKHMGALLIYRRPDDASPGFVADVAARLSASPVHAPWNYRLQGHPLTSARWLAETTDASTHVQYRKLFSNSTADLYARVAEAHSRALPPDRPLWECICFDMPGDRFALYVKVHHACFDGTTGMRLLNGLESLNLDDLREPWGSREPMPENDIQPSHQSSYRGVLTGLFRRFRDVLQGKSTPIRFTAPATCINREVSSRRSFDVFTAERKTFVEIAQLQHVTPHDAVLAVCSAALRDRLLALNALPKRRMLAYLPVSLRARDASGMGNQLGMMLCDLATDVEDPLERLARIYRSTLRRKRFLGQFNTPDVSRYSMLTNLPLTALQSLNLATWFPLHHNVSISFVHGPRQRQHLAGAQLETLAPLSILYSRQPVNITVTDLGDHMDFGIVTCPDTFIEAGDVKDALSHSVEELLAAARGSGPLTVGRGQVQTSSQSTHEGGRR